MNISPIIIGCSNSNLCLLHRDVEANICWVCVCKRQTGAQITVARLFLGASGRPFTVLNLNGPSIRSAGDAAAREIRIALRFCCIPRA